MIFDDIVFDLLPKSLFYVAVSVSLLLFSFRLAALLRLVGSPSVEAVTFSDRLRDFFVYVIGQKRLFRDRYPGLLHAMLFWGFLVLLFGTLETFGKAFRSDFSLPLLGDSPVYRLLEEVSSLIVLVAVVFAAYRRLITRPSRLSLSPGGILILTLIAGLMITQISANAFHSAAGGKAVGWSQPVSGFVSEVYRGSFTKDVIFALFGVSWWSHALLLLGFLSYLPYSKHMHIFAAPLNVLFNNQRSKGALSPIDLQEQEVVGATRAGEFSWKDKLDLLSCTECGRCEENCPAHQSGKSLSPKKIVMAYRNSLLSKRQGDGDLLGDVVSKEAIWSCTTCSACKETCPVLISAVDKIVETRRGLVLTKGEPPSEAILSLRSLERHGNPWGQLGSVRAEAFPKAKMLGDSEQVQTLLFVGCSGSFDERNNQVANALVRVLRKAQVDFALLGAQEVCCGDPARRMGEEYVFQQLARRNIEQFSRHGVRRIVTACAHCYNVLKNEYPQMGGQFEVIHHSELLMGLVRGGKLKLDRPLAKRVTFHDPCYLGRINGVYEAPRQLIRGVSDIKLVEMGRARGNSFCCGGGGGRLWMAEREGKRINQLRLQEAESTGVENVITACPHCLTMLEDAVSERAMEGRLKVADLVELVESASG